MFFGFGASRQEKLFQAGFSWERNNPKSTYSDVERATETS